MAPNPSCNASQVFIAWFALAGLALAALVAPPAGPIVAGPKRVSTNRVAHESREESFGRRGEPRSAAQTRHARTTLPGAVREPLDDEALREKGRGIYQSQCVDCHGDNGQGVEGAYDQALIGDDSIGQLAQVISVTMPEGSPEDCVGPDAEAVAAYMHHAFYSEAAQIRNRPPRQTFARLTANQLRQSYSDLYAAVANGTMWSKPDRGVQGVYFNDQNWNNDEKKLERTDAAIDFDFGTAGPGHDIQATKFYIHWSGGLKVDHSGLYDIVVRCSTSFMFHFGRDGRVFFDNHVQSGDQTEFRGTVYLTAGRIYPFKLEMRQRERKTDTPPAKVQLAWLPPNGAETIIPNENLIPGWCPPAFSLQTELPPDDQSYGYARGILVSSEWDQATTAAAIEFAETAARELWPGFREEYGKKHAEANDRDALNAFLTKLATLALRFPLTADDQQRYIGFAVDNQEEHAAAIKQSLLRVLKSPYFLYPTAGDLAATPSQQMINRLALVLFDSLPADDALAKLADQPMISEEDVRQYVWSKWNDFRVQAKYRELVYQWLHLNTGKELSKNSELFPHFDAAVISDLRQSFDLAITEVLSDSQGDLRTLLTAPRVYTTERLAAAYGETWQVDPTQSARGSFGLSVADESRRGLLTHPLFTSTLSYRNATSPIHRGVVLYRYLLGRTLRPPADDFAPLSPDLHPSLTTRERVELQTSPESCQICHAKINALGFVLEQYDATGRFRTSEGEREVNASGAYVDRSGQEHRFSDARELADYLAGSEEMQRAFVNRAFQHFTKQPAAAFGPQVLDELTASFVNSNCSLPNLLVEIAVIATRPR